MVAVVTGRRLVASSGAKESDVYRNSEEADSVRTPRAQAPAAAARGRVEDGGKEERGEEGAAPPPLRRGHCRASLAKTVSGRSARGSAGRSCGSRRPRARAASREGPTHQKV